MDNPYYIGLADNPEPPEEEKEPEVVAECERCGEELTEADESLALVGTDGKVKHFCQDCLNYARWFPESVIKDILDAAGICYATGYADEADTACKAEVNKMKVSGGVNG